MMKKSYAGIGIAIGGGVGATHGVALDNVAIWLPVGIAVCVAIGAGINKKK